MRGRWRKLMWWPCVPSRSPQGSLTGQALTSFPYQPQFKHSAVILRLELWNATTLLAKECLTKEPKEKAKHVDFRLRPLRLYGSLKVVTSVQLVELHITVLVQQRRIHNLYQLKIHADKLIHHFLLLIKEMPPHITLELNFCKWVQSRVLIEEDSTWFSVAASFCGLGYSQFTQITKNWSFLTYTLVFSHTGTFIFSCTETYVRKLLMSQNVVTIIFFFFFFNVHKEGLWPWQLQWG